ncbi:hypothetical protein [Pseudonocardia pini]|nr:hypothetical protein [Pseudonocardia pini]
MHSAPFTRRDLAPLPLHTWQPFAEAEARPLTMDPGRRPLLTARSTDA